MSVVSPSAPSGDLPNLGLSAGLAATLKRGPADQTLATATKPTAIQAEYQTLIQQDTAELLYASGLGPAAALANGTAVLSQAAKLTSSDGKLNYTTIPDLPLPGALPKSATSGTSTSAAAAHPSVGAPAIKSVTQLLAESDAAARTTLAAYAKAPAGSSLLDFQA